MRGKGQPSRARAVLPIELQCKLSFTSVADGIGYLSKRVVWGIVQEIRVANIRAEIRVIQEVEELSPEFQIRIFCRAEFLENREVEVGVSRPVHLVPGTSQGAEIGLPYGRRCRRLNESRGT